MKKAAAAELPLGSAAGLAARSVAETAAGSADAVSPLLRIVDDDEDVRASLAFMLACEGWETRAFASAEAFLSGDTPSRPGCLLLDVRMPGRSGLELQAELVRRREKLPIIFLTAHGDIGMAVGAMREGAFDFIAKPVDPERLLPAVARAVEADLAARGAGVAGVPAEAATLTGRELEIIRLAASGVVSRAIAERLSISRRTVEHYRASALKKLGVQDAAGAARVLARLDVAGSAAPKAAASSAAVGTKAVPDTGVASGTASFSSRREAGHD